VSQPERIDQAADLLERLLTDPGFRAKFRRGPDAVCRDYGLPDVAQELTGTGRALYTLEMRESKSPLAGVLLAAAAEGVGLYDILADGIRGEAASTLDRVLSRTTLPAVEQAHAATLPRPDAEALDADADRASGRGERGDAPRASASRSADAEPERPEEPATASPEPRLEGSPARAPAPQSAVEAPAPQSAVEAPAPAAAAASDSTDRAEDAVPTPAVPGGGAGASLEALLDNPRLKLPEGARSDLASGKVDPRLVAVLGKLVERHEVGLSVIKTGHDQFTSSGSVSNHFHGRGIDIASVDGRPVNVSNLAARDLVEDLAALPKGLRPEEVGAPWDLAPAEFFSDQAHQDHIHVAFDSEAPAELPPGLAQAADASAGPVPAAVGAGQVIPLPQAPAAAAAEAPAAASLRAEDVARPAPRESGVFAAVTERKRRSSRNSVQFLRAVTPESAEASSDQAGVPPGSPGAPADDQVMAAALLEGQAMGQGPSVMLDRVRGELGQVESPPGSNNSPRIAMYRAATAGAPGPGPWCAYFVSWAAKEAGMPLFDRGQGHGSVDHLYEWAKRTGRAMPVGSGTPRPGDLIVWDEHIGVVEKVLPDGTIQTIEGNSSDRVARRLHGPREGDLVGFVRMGR
jgi:CHAP domain